MVYLENIKKLYLSDIQFSLNLIKIDKNAINLPIFLLKNRIVISRISQKRQNFDVVDSIRLRVEIFRWNFTKYLFFFSFSHEHSDKFKKIRDNHKQLKVKIGKLKENKSLRFSCFCR
jgi:hypothetical protein